MYKCEIVTDVERHQIDLEGFENLEKAYKYVDNTLKYSGAGNVVNFWGKTAILVLDLNHTVVKSWKIWYEDPNPLGLRHNWYPPEPEKAIDKSLVGQTFPMVPWDWAGHAKFLGQKIVVKGIAHEHKSKLYLMPLFINDMHPYTALGGNNLVSFLEILRNKYNFDVVVAPPAVDFTDAEAYTFLYEYAEQSDAEEPTTDPAEITARSAGMLWDK